MDNKLFNQSFIKSKKIGIIITYLVIIANTISTLLLTPMYLKYFGINDYGLYQMIYAVANYILILDFGISITMVRYISTYHAKNDYESEKNFAAHCLSFVIIINAIILLIGFVVNSKLTSIYPTISVSEQEIAHKMFMIMVLNIMSTIVMHYFQGIIIAYEHFVVINGISFGIVLFKLIIKIVLLITGSGLVSVVFADFIVILIGTFFLAIYSFSVIKFKIVFSKFDKALIASIASFMFAIFLQSVVQYANNTIDKTILGIMTSKSDVAIYSVAMSFITLFNSLPTALSGVFLPSATKLVQQEASREELTKFVSRAGRYQFMICGALIAGFFLFGKEFIFLWSGKDTLESWKVALIIMVPNMFPLIEYNVTTILDAKKKRLFRSLTLLGISILNVGISVLLVYKFGMIGAPIGTAFSYIIGYIIILNIYYQKKIGINVLPMFKQIFNRIWICIIIPTAICYPLNIAFKEYSWIFFIVKVIAFCIIFFASLLLIGLNIEEKEDINGLLQKVIKKVKKA